jgi:hypothetical protein
MSNDDSAFSRALHEELNRRIHELAGPDATPPPMTRGDALLVLALFVLLPALAIWWFA